MQNLSSRREKASKIRISLVFASCTNIREDDGAGEIGQAGG